MSTHRLGLYQGDIQYYFVDYAHKRVENAQTLAIESLRNLLLADSKQKFFASFQNIRLKHVPLAQERVLFINVVKEFGWPLLEEKFLSVINEVEADDDFSSIESEKMAAWKKQEISDIKITGQLALSNIAREIFESMDKTYQEMQISKRENTEFKLGDFIKKIFSFVVD